MQPILLLAFVAVASCGSLGWRTEGNFQSPDYLSALQRVNRLTPAQQSAQQIGREIQQTQNVIQEGLGSDRVIKSDAAQQAAHEVVQQALLARQGQTVEGIQQLEQQQRIAPQNIAQQVTTNEAIDKLQKQLVFQQTVAPVIAATSELGRTLEAAIESQLTIDNVNTQQWGRGRQSDLHSGVFLAKVEQLVDENIIQEIQTEISRQQGQIKQLQQQKILLDQQKQKIQVQLSSVQEDQESRLQLQEVQQQLQRQEEELVNQQLARQLVIQQLQQALFEQQQQLQQDIVGELQSQTWSDRVKRFDRSVGINRFLTLTQRVPSQFRPYGLFESQKSIPWSIYGNSWSRSGTYSPRTTWVA
ncbi:hypothetical protein HUJ04_003793 [Dendroctonus ponderosae]|uniref:Uncharacterized protein n=1 Tax=Dendroctonus ponderosae TaxID=77166 RepID=A0AAR5QIV5_DENPD|nr:hypothetical protein HUJ04_003793 [Dendroctonus ponderosae]